MKFITVEDGQFVLWSFDVVEQAPPRRIKLARMIKPLPVLAVPHITYDEEVGFTIEEEHMKDFFDDLYEEAPYLKEAPQDEVLALYKAGLLNVWEDTDGEW